MQRTDYIGGADAGTLLGRNDYNNIKKAWRKKLGRELDDPANKHMARGIATEPYIHDHIVTHVDPTCNAPELRKKYSTPESYDEWVTWNENGRQGVEPQIFMLSPVMPFVGGHPDGVGKKVLWEYKAPAPRTFERIIKFGVDESWITQDQHYQWIAAQFHGNKITEGRLAIWDFNEWAPIIIRVKPDLKLWREFDRIYPAFWFHVETKTEPAIEGYTEAIDFVPDGLMDDILADYIKSTEDRYSSETTQKQLRSIILTYMDGRAKLETENHSVSASRQSRYNTEFVRLVVKQRNNPPTEDPGK